LDQVRLNSGSLDRLYQRKILEAEKTNLLEAGLLMRTGVDKASQRTENVESLQAS